MQRETNQANQRVNMKVSTIYLILKSARFFYDDDDDKVFSNSMQRKSISISISIQFLFQSFGATRRILFIVSSDRLRHVIILLLSFPINSSGKFIHCIFVSLTEKFRQNVQKFPEKKKPNPKGSKGWGKGVGFKSVEISLKSHTERNGKYGGE